MIEPSRPQLKKLQPRDKQNRPIRVLYVEDAQVLRDTTVQLLEIYGYKVATAKNGQEGIEMVLQWKPDLVLMDLRMPV